MGITSGLKSNCNGVEHSVDKDKLWSKYWIEGGIEVVHRNYITVLNKDRLGLFKMTVDRVVKKSKDREDGSRKVFIDGVRCHWLDGEMKYQVGQFHTNELVPFKVAEKGMEEVNKWLVREIFVEKKDSEYKGSQKKGVMK